MRNKASIVTNTSPSKNPSDLEEEMLKATLAAFDAGEYVIPSFCLPAYFSTNTLSKFKNRYPIKFVNDNSLDNFEEQNVCDNDSKLNIFYCVFNFFITRARNMIKWSRITKLNQVDKKTRCLHWWQNENY